MSDEDIDRAWVSCCLSEKIEFFEKSYLTKNQATLSRVMEWAPSRKRLDLVKALIPIVSTRTLELGLAGALYENQMDIVTLLFPLVQNKTSELVWSAGIYGHVEMLELLIDQLPQETIEEGIEHLHQHPHQVKKIKALMEEKMAERQQETLDQQTPTISSKSQTPFRL